MKQWITALALSLAFATSAVALEKERFTEDRFEALQAAGEVVLVDVWADWCPTCKKQQAVLKQYASENPDKPFHVLVVDFDKDKQWVRHFRAPRQSTLLLYAGEEQFWYSVAEIRPEIIGAEIDKAVAARNKAVAAGQ